VVIVICPALEDTVRAIDPHARVVLIENAPGSGEEQPSAADAARIRAQFQFDAATPLVLYTGTFEAYQGLDLLFAAMAHVHERRPDARLLLAGGKADQVARARRQAAAAGIGGVTLFAGERPASEVPAYLLASDVLVSPRSRGTNTPLKIYQYLRSGKPIVATRLLTHTQVLDDETAILTDATPSGFAEGILGAIADPAGAAAIAATARHLAETKYSYAAYIDKTRRAIRELASEPPLPDAVKDVA
jgi:glycosyltransferase involved in cell wall biosynthesis